MLTKKHLSIAALVATPLMGMIFMIAGGVMINRSSQVPVHRVCNLLEWMEFDNGNIFRAECSTDEIILDLFMPSSAQLKISGPVIVDTYFCPNDDRTMVSSETSCMGNISGYVFMVTLGVILLVATFVFLVIYWKFVRRDQNARVDLCCCIKDPVGEPDHGSFRTSESGYQRSDSV